MKQEERIPRSIGVTAFLVGFAMFAQVASVPPMEHIFKEELLITHAQASLLFTIPFAMLAALSIVGGSIGDRVGVKKAGGIGLIIMVVGSMLRGTATDYHSLLAFTVLYGIGFGLVFPNVSKLISVGVPLRKAGVAMGMFIAGMASGSGLPMAITLPAIYPITNTIQGTLLIWSIPAIVITILWWILLKEQPNSDIANESQGQSRVPLREVLKNKYLWIIACLLLLHNFFTYIFIVWTPVLMAQKGATPDIAAIIASLFVWLMVI